MDLVKELICVKWKKDQNEDFPGGVQEEKEKSLQENAQVFIP